MERPKQTRSTYSKGKWHKRSRSSKKSRCKCEEKRQARGRQKIIRTEFTSTQPVCIIKAQRAVHKSRHKNRKTGRNQTKVSPDDQNSSHHKSLQPSNKVICSMSRWQECGWNDLSLLCQPDYRQAVTAALLIRVTDKLARHI